MTVKVNIIVFPGSNCDRDIAVSIRSAGMQVEMIWHGDAHLPKSDFIIIPGGFSYGDYLRCGAMAAQSPVMREVITHANNGVSVLGICNGFQILTECGLLPGVLMRNKNLNFICRDTHLIVETNDNIFTKNYQKGQKVTIPIAHNDGNYFADKETLKKLDSNEQIIFRYMSDDNPNGSCLDIAGITNEAGNVLGMMPHPERHCEKVLGGEDGKALFSSMATILR